jgi:5-methylcytosine-specific restriction endonuclease McrA
MPLWKLQTVSGTVDEFLYARRSEARATIELLPGVAFTLRRFHGFLEEIVRSAWVRFVRRLQHNRDILGDTKDLHEFLFGSERASLEPYRPILRDLQAGRCFYCDRPIAPRSEHVDHFIPWSRYGMDLAHNFVLADWSCNDSKSDLLASTDHMRRWTSRNAVHGNEIVSRFDGGNLLHDLSASRAITHWAYTLAAASASKVWTRARPRDRSTMHGAARSIRPYPCNPWFLQAASRLFTRTVDDGDACCDCPRATACSSTHKTAATANTGIQMMKPAPPSVASPMNSATTARCRI